MSWRRRQGLRLVVTNIDDARSELLARGAEVRELFHFAERGQRPGPDPQRRDYNVFLSFNDPDGNGWLVRDVGRT